MVMGKYSLLAQKRSLKDADNERVNILTFNSHPTRPINPINPIFLKVVLYCPIFWPYVLQIQYFDSLSVLRTIKAQA